MSAVLQVNKVVAISIKVTAALSMLCSGYIVYTIIGNPQKRAIAKERILLGLSCLDIVFSFFWFLSTWPIPRGTPNVYGAIGNTQTCSLQGFFIQLGVMGPMYNGFLALYCYLYVCKNYSRQQMRHIEIFGHVFIWVFGLSIAIAGLLLDLYNSIMVVCSIAPFPRNCTQSFELSKMMQNGDATTTTDCIRGHNALIYRWAFLYAMIWINILLTLVCFLLIYLYIRKQEKTMDSYTSEFKNNSNNNSSRNSDSRAVAFRGALFTGAFFITWVPITLAETLRLSDRPISLGESFAIAITIFTLISSQGIFNFLIYIQPAVSRYWNERNSRRRMLLDRKQHQQPTKSKEQAAATSSDEQCNYEKEKDNSSEEKEEIVGESDLPSGFIVDQ